MREIDAERGDLRSRPGMSVAGGSHCYRLRFRADANIWRYAFVHDEGGRLSVSPEEKAGRIYRGNGSRWPNYSDRPVCGVAKQSAPRNRGTLTSDQRWIEPRRFDQPAKEQRRNGAGTTQRRFLDSARLGGFAASYPSPALLRKLIGTVCREDKQAKKMHPGTWFP